MRKKKVIFSLMTFITSLGLMISLIILGICVVRARKNPNFISNNMHSADAKVLFCCSNFSRFTFLTQETGIREVFDRKNVCFSMQFIDASPARRDLHEDYYNLLKFKVEENKGFDLILVSGDYALDLINKYHVSLFGDTPILFYNISDRNLETTMLRDHHAYGIESQQFYDDALDMAIKMFPKTTEIISIIDANSFAVRMWKKFCENQERYPGKKFSYINSSELSKAEMQIKLKNISTDAVVFFFNAITDNSGNSYSYSEQIDFITDNTDAPVFAANEEALGHGIVAGKFPDYHALSVQAAQLALNIIEQKKHNITTDEVHFTATNKGVYYIDISELKKFDVNSKNLPESYFRINGNIDSVINKQRIIYSSVAVFIFLLLFIVISMLLTVREVQRNKEMADSNKKMEYLIGHDFLTNLPNRMKAIEVYNKLVQAKKNFSVILIDIDDFKNINDLNSHSCGDQVLKVIATRLLNIMHEGVFFFARFGGDEFLALYTDGFLTEDNPDLFALQNVFNAPVIFGNKKINVAASIGIANSSVDKRETIDDIIANADISMYQSKRNGKNQFTFFNEKMKDEIHNNARIEKILTNAIENDNIEVVYQPQFDALTKEVYGFEALMRLKDKSVGPAQFIPVAEDTGLIIKIDRIITEKVIQQIDDWRKKGYNVKKVSINYSYGQISDINYVKFLTGLIKQYQIPPELIGIEITESLFVANKEKAMRLFNDFAQNGIKLALDDFGTGYSSLSYLTYLPVSIVKIDKTLVDNYLNTSRDGFIKNIVRLVHSLDMKLVCEGVETEYQYEKLKDYKCDYIQGYYFSKPIPGDEVPKFLV